MKRVLLSLTTFLLLFSMQGRAQSPTAPALGFNVFLQNGGTLITNESEGPVAMGGDMTLTGSSYQIATNYTGTYQVSGVTIGLLVGGKINYTAGNGVSINSNTYVKIGNSTGSYVWYVDQNNAYSPIRITPGQNYNGSPRINLQANSQNLGVSAVNNPVFQSNLVDFTTAFNTMKASSVCMSGKADNATITNANGATIPHTGLPNQIKITLNAGLNVLNLTGADMNNVQSLTYNNTPDATHVLIINVNGGSTFNWSVWNSAGNIGLTSSSYVIYNFYNTTTLNIQGNGAVEGTVFAPYADITKSVNQANIEGQIIGKSYYHSGGENHYAVFTPSITGCGTGAGFTINDNDQCLTGNSFVFTNTSTGSSLSYAWKFGDGTTSTSTSPTKTYSSAGTYTVKLKVTGSGGVDSMSQTVTVNPMVTPSVSISANPGTTVCSGSSVVFTATPVNGGASPSYQWKKNGSNIGSNSATYTTSNLSDNDVITCVMTSNATCRSSNTATSNALTMEVNSNVTPYVLIWPNTGLTTCSGTTVTVYAVPFYGGSAPTYQWTLNGVLQGSDSASLILTAPADNDIIKCVMTSNYSCVTSAIDTSNTIEMTVNPSVTPSVSVGANPGNSICPSTSVTFTATPVNGGSSPTYQWKKNGSNVGSGGTTYTTSSISNNDVITCVLTSNAACATTTTATSTPVTMTVNPTVTPSVSISANPGTTICASASVTFTATPVNGGSSPSYQWKKNGSNVGTNSPTYTASGLANGNTITCVMTSNAPCATTTTATSNTLTMTVNATVVPSLTISANPGTSICGGTSVSFSITPVNGGSTPTYQWKKNGTNVGNTNTSYTLNAPSNNDVITCEMTSNASCVSTPTVLSNALTLTVTPTVTPSVSIAANPGTSICPSTPVTFTATPVNGGSTPAYQWKKNGVNTGTNSATYLNSTPANNDVITCVLTSNASCATATTATSNALTITVNSTLTPSVSISSNNGSSICANTSVTFTASPVNGGATPSYQWKRNGNNEGSNSASFTPATLNNNDVVSCVMTTSVACASQPTATSNGITMTVTAPVVPSVSISANPGTTVCANTSVTFTAVPVNGGSTPVYQWKKNGIVVGSNSPTYALASPANNDIIVCKMTTSASCASPLDPSSNTLTMTVNPVVTPSVSISSNAGLVICQGTPVTFTATPVNGGSTPAYQWKKNGVNDGTNSANYTPASLSNNDVVSCIMTSNASCASIANATSNGLTMTVNPTLTPSVSINANTGSSICQGTSVTFTATPVNGGSTPAYQWKKNNVNVGGNSNTYAFASFNNNDVVTCVMTSNASCLSTPAATSNTITMTVSTAVTPSVSISSTPSGTVCSGTPVTFTAVPVNGGSTPSYQWKKNGGNVGTNNAVYTDNALVNNDVISCVLTSNAGCATTNTATSNSITMTIGSGTAQPGAFTVSSPVTYQGQVGVTYTVPNVAGVTYAWSYSGTGVTINGSGNSVVLDFGITATSGDLSVTASVAGGCGPSAPRTVSILVKPYITWVCQTGVDWNTASNWDCGFVPYGTISVLIPATSSCQPSLDGITGNCRDLMIDSNAHIFIDANAVLNSKGFVRLHGNVTGGGYLKLTGSGNQPVSGNGRVDNLELNNPQGATINNGDTIHIGKHYKPGNGTLTTNGGLELLSDSSATAVILSNNTSCNYISGEVICDKYIHGGRRAFRFFGHPYSHSIPLSQLTPFIDITGQNGDVNGFTTTPTNNPSSFWYNTLTGNGSTVNDSTGWIPFTHTNGAGANAWNKSEGIRVLVRGAKGEGFGCCPYDPSPLTFKTHGLINECDVVASCQTNGNQGYNFIANPYACNIDLSQAARGTSVGANFSVWDPNQGVSGAYVAQPFNFSYILPAYSAFITTCTSNSNNSITFHESDKTADDATGNLFKTTGGFGSDVVQLRILSNNDSLSWDRLLLFFNGQSVSAYDPLDNIKMGNPALDFYTFSSDAKPLSVDVRPMTNGEVIPLGLKALNQQSYAIRVDDYEVPVGAQLYLHDKFLNQVQPLSAGMHYNFDVTSDPLSQGDNRFEINTDYTATQISNVPGKVGLKVNMMPNPASENVVISFEAATAEKTTIRITDLTGKQVYLNVLGEQKEGNVNISLNGIAQGVYMVHLTSGSQTITKRLIRN